MSNVQNPNAKKRIRSGEVTVKGVTATRTRKAEKKGVTRNSVAERTVEEKREIAYLMSMEYVAQADIAKALGLSQVRISQLINQECDIRREQRAKTAEQWREFEIARNESLISAWAGKAKTDERAADVVLGHATRGDKLKGLYVSRQEVSGPGGGPLRLNATALDMSRYTEEELKVLEHLVEKGTVTKPPEEGAV